MTPEMRVTLKTGKQAWSADFVASDQVLSDRDAYVFVFSVLDHHETAGNLRFSTRARFELPAHLYFAASSS